MIIHFTQLLFAVSKALDQIEQALLGVSTYHCKRIAYISAAIGEKLELSPQQRMELAACCVLHDSALTEYIHAEYQKGNDLLKNKLGLNLAIHCMKGERNMKYVPMSSDVNNAVLYHHEHFDGTGPFRKKGFETPLYAQIIHLADQVDGVFDCSDVSEQKYADIQRFLAEYADVLFSSELCEQFLACFPDADSFLPLREEALSKALFTRVPSEPMQLSPQQLMGFAKLFASIIDYQSTQASQHSLAIAQKAYDMGKFYILDEETCAKLYFAGAMHDIGKLLTQKDASGLPAGMTEQESNHLHALHTYEILCEIEGMEDVALWAASHHERLDGSGSPFGKSCEEMDRFERIIACLDLYQSMLEGLEQQRALSHQEAIAELSRLVEQKQLDSAVVQDIHTVFAESQRILATV